jgi:F-type H+-transporting ATPase subunit alpha
MSVTHKHDEVGFVVKAKRYILSIEGLPSARVNDLIVDEHGKRAIVRALYNDHITALSFSDSARPGTRFTYIQNPNTYYCGDELFGRTIDALGSPIDGLGALPPANVPLSLEVEAPGIEVRVPIHEQLFTGITLVDTLVPIAKGQRQLVFGPMHSGKSTFLTETILAQQALGTICIYAVIGKPIVGLRKVSDTILKTGAKGKTIVVAALSDEPASMVSLAPSVHSR